eukprot:14401517-Ditylum_brightwellii.AAC.1
MPHAVELSVMTRVGGWGWPISLRARHNSSPFLVLTYIAPISASAVLDMMLCMTLHTVCTGPFVSGGVTGCFSGSADAALR